MNILGLEYLVFGVDDMPGAIHGRKNNPAEPSNTPPR